MLLYSYLREWSETNVGVRVAVHSGRVETAIVGLARWRYDVWSADVQLLENVVHAALPGSVMHSSQLVTGQLSLASLVGVGKSNTSFSWLGVKSGMNATSAGLVSVWHVELP